MIKISEIQIIPVKANEGLVGFASCVIENGIYLGSIGIITKMSGGFRLVFPTKKIGDKNFHYHHPINSEASRELENAICAKAEKVLSASFY